MFGNRLGIETDKQGNSIIAVLLLALAWIIILPISGLVDILSPNDDSKIIGSAKLVIGIGIWLILISVKILG